MSAEKECHSTFNSHKMKFPNKRGYKAQMGTTENFQHLQRLAYNVRLFNKSLTSEQLHAFDFSFN